MFLQKNHIIYLGLQIHSETNGSQTQLTNFIKTKLIKNIFFQTIQRGALKKKEREGNVIT